jgi:hypothetical protein
MGDKGKIAKNFRDLLDGIQLKHLGTAEEIVAETIWTVRLEYMGRLCSGFCSIEYLWWASMASVIPMSPDTTRFSPVVTVKPVSFGSIFIPLIIMDYHFQYFNCDLVSSSERHPFVSILPDNQIDFFFTI